MQTDRKKMRMVFFEAWRKYQAKQNLEPLEKQIATIILQHPEYHFILDNSEKYLDQDYFPSLGDTNPFLHLSLHLSVLEQVNTNRPAGIQRIYYELIKKYGDNKAAEHQIMELIAQNLWEAQQSGKMISDEVYLEQLKKLL